MVLGENFVILHRFYNKQSFACVEFKEFKEVKEVKAICLNAKYPAKRLLAITSSDQRER